MTDCNVRLAEIEALANLATPGPWQTGDDGTTLHVDEIEIADCGYEYGRSLEMAQCKVNAAFIAATRTDVLWLVDELRKAEAALRKYGWHLENCRLLDRCLPKSRRRCNCGFDPRIGVDAAQAKIDAARNAVATKGDAHE